MSIARTAHAQRAVGRALLLATLAAALIGFVARSGLEFERSDFFVLHAAADGVWHGVDVYDEAGQQARLGPGVTLPPFGYPPWYVLATSGLGLLPRDAAGRLWMLANLTMALGAAALLTSGWSPRARALAFAAAVLYAPTMGLIRVGQFTMPVVLGAALLVNATRGGPAWAGAAGLALLTFKPHLGGLVALGALPWLVREGRRSLTRGLALVALLAATSFLVSPSWPVAYPASALRLARHPMNVACDTCSSASASLAAALGGGAAWLGVALFACVVAMAWRLRPDPATLVAIGAVAAPLAVPYVRNYDYPLLVVPMLVGWARGDRIRRLLIVAAWALPLAAVVALSRSTSAHLFWIGCVLVLPALARGEVRERDERPVPSAAPVG